jgi:hypothetical protein
MEPQLSLDALQRAFVPPRELRSSPPRNVRLTAGGKFLSAVAVALFAGAVVAGVGLHREATRQADERRALAVEGRGTDAAVTRLWRSSGDSKQPWVAYRFEAAGLAQDGQSKISLSQWRALQVGSTLPIRYVSTNPSQNVPAGREPGGIPRWLPFVAAAAMVSVGLLLLFVIGVQRRLLMEGRAAPAMVTKHIKLHTTHGGSHNSMTYTFPLLSGAAAKGQSSTSSKPPAVGSVICVLYDPERPRRSMPYPLQFVRPD